MFHKSHKFNKTFHAISLFPFVSLEGAVGGDPEEFELIEPMSYKRVAVDEGGEIQIGSIMLQVVSGDITLEKTDAIVNGTNRQLRHLGKSACFISSKCFTLFGI